MTALPLFVVLVIVALLFASPRTAPLWLGMQAVALAWSVVATHGVHSTHAQLAVAELLLVRGLLAPWLLHRATRDEQVDHLLPSNLFAWMLAIGLLVLASQFARAGSLGGGAVAMVGVATSVLLALLLLSLNETGAAQLFALLLMENAALLFESTLPEPWSPWVHAVLTSTYVVTVWVGVRLLPNASEESAPGPPRRVL
jgi:hydrogenase-4 membrane subunit HyfE